jgi:hypothetical protein
MPAIFLGRVGDGRTSNEDDANGNRRGRPWGWRPRKKSGRPWLREVGAATQKCGCGEVEDRACPVVGIERDLPLLRKPSRVPPLRVRMRMFFRMRMRVLRLMGMRVQRGRGAMGMVVPVVNVVREREGVKAGEPGDDRRADRKWASPPKHLRIIRSGGVAG